MNETDRSDRSSGSRCRPCWISAVALFLGACGADGPVPDRNTEVAVSPDSVHTLATLDVVTRVVDLQPTSDGRVWVLNSMAPYFVVLGPNGQVERQFGARGGGPQEFGAPLELVRGSDPSEVWTYDVRRNALIRISAGERRELALGDSMPVPSLVSFKGAGINPAAPWLESTKDGFLLSRARVPRDESALHLWNADILLIRQNGSEVKADLRMPIADFLGDPASRFGAATILLPYPLWTVCEDGVVGLYDPLVNTLRRFAETREEIAAAALPEERGVQMTPDLVFEMFYRQFAEDRPAAQLPPKEEMRSRTEEQNRQFVSSSAPTFPEYSDLRCAPDGTLWLRRFDVNNGRLGQGSDWLRFSADGSRMSFALPTTFRTFRIESDRIWGTAKDSLGVESVAWIGLQAPR
jgi:hypothetical protein